jgi:hypothetical protein
VNAWSDNDYKPVPPDSGLLSNAWVNHGGDLVRARVAAGKGTAFRAEGVTIYQRDNGAIRRIIDAERAAPDGAQWRLENVRIYDSTMNFVRKVPAMEGLAGLTPDQLRLAQVDPDETSFVQLAAKISEMRAAGKPTAEARAGLWHKISGPLSIVLMPLLAAVAAFGLARSGQVLLRASIGMALGFAYFVADNFSLAMGNVGAYPPLLAAWAPFFLFLLVGETVLIRSEEEKHLHIGALRKHGLGLSCARLDGASARRPCCPGVSCADPAERGGAGDRDRAHRASVDRQQQGLGMDAAAEEARGDRPRRAGAAAPAPPRRKSVSASAPAAPRKPHHQSRKAAVARLVIDRVLS